MSKPNIRESEPLFWAFGHAVYAAQLLEHGMRLLLHVVNYERQRANLPLATLDIDSSEPPKTLGTLFNEVLAAEYITDAERRFVWAAVRDRNVLVHSYWDEKHTLATLTPKGREWIIADLLERKKRCRRADEIISSLVDRYLAAYGTSISEISAPLFETWQNDNEPPADVLH
jgi:hypothetical protein